MYISDFALNWFTNQLAGQAITISLHTGVPGNAGADNEMSSAGNANYGRALVTADQWTSEMGTVDNDANIDIFTPNADSAGQTVTHVAYWLGVNFFGWTALTAAQDTFADVPFTIAAGTADITIQRAA